MAIETNLQYLLCDLKLA